VDSIARVRFEEVAAGFPRPAATYPVVTRSLSTLVWLLRNKPVLALLPHRSMAAWLAQGLLSTVAMDTGFSLEPVGVLQPEQGTRAAPVLLARWLLSADAEEPPGGGA
jgi:DNA-binding transcriptional LysR family regulator